MRRAGIAPPGTQPSGVASDTFYSCEQMPHPSTETFGPLALPANSTTNASTAAQRPERAFDHVDCAGGGRNVLTRQEE
jgi:hypothetical protein